MSSRQLFSIVLALWGFVVVYAHADEASVDNGADDSLQPICGGQPGDPCWLPLQSHPGCHIWNPNPHEQETARFEGNATCMDGKISGVGKSIWRFLKEGEWETDETPSGPYRYGKMHGEWVEIMDDGLRAEGSYFDGLLEGEWTYSDSEGNVIAGGNWVNGLQEGPWIQANITNGWRGEGQFVGGKRQGPWVFTESNGWRADANFVDGVEQGDWAYTQANGDREEGKFVDGKRNGGWVVEEADGDREEGNFVAGQKHGDWTHRNARTGLTINRTYQEDELIGLGVVSTPSPRPTDATSGNATVTGAFGITLGSDLAQLKHISCPSDGDPDRDCLEATSGPYRWRFDLYNALEPGHRILEEKYDTSGFTIVPPQPVAGGREYTVSYDLWTGQIIRVATEFHFPSEAACEAEESRLRKLLEEKYGECKNPIYNPNQVGYTPIGQCDARGLIEREILAICVRDLAISEDGRLIEGDDGEFVRAESSTLRLKYEILYPGIREQIFEAWMQTGKPSAEDL